MDRAQKGIIFDVRKKIGDNRQTSMLLKDKFSKKKYPILKKKPLPYVCVKLHLEVH